MGKLSSPSAEALIATFHPYTITSRSLPFQVKAVSQQAQKLLTRKVTEKWTDQGSQLIKSPVKIQWTHTYF